jgi:hypothetical protein
MPTPARAKILDCCLIVATVMLFLWPEADPSWLKPANDIHDAAWWADPAKQKLLNGSWMNGPFAGALAVGPLTVWLHFISFKIFGLSFFSLRLVSLIPAVLTAALLRFQKDSISKNTSALLLLTSTSWFISARLGLPELWMGFMLLVAIQLLNKGSAGNSVVAAFCLLAGILLKASFVYQLPLVLPVLFFNDNKQSTFSKASFFATFLIASTVYYLIYLLPNQGLFAPFLAEFSANYFTVNQLLDPVGILARIVFLTDREFFQDPTVVLLLVGLLIKLSSGFRPASRSSFTLLFFLGVLFLLPSDFAGRRFIPLFPLLIVASIEPYAQGFISDKIKLFLAVLMNWVVLGIVSPPSLLFSFADGFFQFQMLFVVFLGVQLVVLLLIWKLSKAPADLFSAYFKYSASVLCLAWIALVLRTHFTENALLIVIFSATTMLIMQLLFSAEKFKRHALVFLVGVGFICNCASFVNLSHTERNNALEISQIVKEKKGLSAGNATTFSLTFLSSSSAMHFPMSSYWKSAQPMFLGAYSTTDLDPEGTLDLMDQLKEHYRFNQETNCIPLQVWSTHQKGEFCYPRRVK